MLQKWCWSSVVEDIAEVVLQKTLLQKKLLHLWQVNVHQPFFICLFFTFVFSPKCSRWRRACLASRHLMHLRKKLRNDDEPSNLPSSTTHEKKNKEMTMSRGGSPSSVTPKEKKKKKMMTSQGSSPSSITTMKKCRRWQWARRLLACCHLLGFFSTMSLLTTSPPNASPGFLWCHWLHHHLMHLLGFYDLTNYITTWCISWVFMISSRFHWLHHHLMHFLGFYDLTKISLITSPWVFMISLKSHWLHHHLMHLLLFCDVTNCITT